MANAASPVEPVLYPVVSGPVQPPLFQGKKKEKTRQTLAWHQQLLDAGISPDGLRRFDATLWQAKIKDRKGEKSVRLTVDGGKKTDWKALKKWLAEKLAGFDKVEIRERSVSKCCHSPCGGCLNGCSATRKVWVG